MTTYYVDPAGSDAADGQSVASAWQTVTKVNAATFTAGDSILFKRGGTWRGVQLTPPTAGSAGNTVTFADYGSGALPVISGGTLVTGWSVFSGNTYSATLAGATNYVLAAAQPLTKGASTTLTANQWFQTGGALYVNLNGANPASVTVEASQLAACIKPSSKDYLTFRNLDVQFSTDQALYLNACARTLVDSCTFRYHCTTSNGGTVLVTGGSDSRITNCTWDHLQNDGVWIHNHPRLEVDHFTMTNVGELVGDLASDGIQLDDESFGTGLDSSGLWIHDGVITMSPNSPKGGILVGSNPTKATFTSGTVERVTVNGGNFGVAPFASNLTVRDCSFLDQVSSFGGGIHVDVGTFDINDVVITRCVIARSTRAGIIFQSGVNNRKRWIVVNNSFVDCAWLAVALLSPAGGVWKDNIIWYTSVAPTLGMVNHNGGGVAAGDTMAWDYNLIRDPGSGNPFVGPTGTAYASFALWKAGTGYDAHSLGSDPLFTNAAGGVFTLTPASPARNAGVAVAGIGQMVRGSAPDIGAFENPAVALSAAGVGA